MPFDISRRALVGSAAATLLLPGDIAAQEAEEMKISREFMWRRVMDDLSFEHARVGPGNTGPEITGTILVAEQGSPLRLDYRIGCDDGWRTRSVDIMQAHLGRQRALRLDHDGEGRWHIDGRDAPTLAGCADVDLGLSPSTNALPINRLRLAEGASGVIQTAWVRFPDLDVVPAEQSYQRVSDRHYRYRSLASGFQAMIEVDQDGLPIDYAGIWRRVAEGPGTNPFEAPAPFDGFAGALLADGPSVELAQAADDFGWLVGGWTARVRDFDRSGGFREASGEWWFAWVLEGRAMQDVWISPSRADRGQAAKGFKDRYGTTIRRFDRDAGLWRITWINPVNGSINHLAGRREGDRILLLGQDGDTSIRWSFNRITPRSFTWLGESRRTDGGWQVEAEFELARIT